MKSWLTISIAFVLIIFMASGAWAYPQYIGYSGSPGRQACSVSCHHSHGLNLSVTVTGFPDSYNPGQQYTIAVSSNGGTFISNFNCSARIGTGSSNAGVIAAGTNTSTYNTGGETNGVHLTNSFTNSGNFRWTAPAAGTGDVKLYLALLQGGVNSGSDTQVVLTSSENMTGIGEETQLPAHISLAQNYPNPFNSETIINFSLSEPDQAELTISNILGQMVYSKSVTFNQPGSFSITWDGRDRNGVDVPSGVYFYQLRTSRDSLTRRMILLR